VVQIEMDTLKGGQQGQSPHWAAAENRFPSAIPDILHKGTHIYYYLREVQTRYIRDPIYNDLMREVHTRYIRDPIYNDLMREVQTRYIRDPIYNDLMREVQTRYIRDLILKP
jgi:hypothetical protein